MKSFSNTNIARFFLKDTGQVIAEIVLVLPVFLVALFVSVAVFVFISEAARVDRITNEICREIFQLASAPSQEALNEIVEKSLLKYKSNKYQVSLRSYHSPTTHINHRHRIVMTIEYRPFSNRYLRQSKRFNPGSIKKVKKLYTAGWDAGAIF